jgi:hypothetical protein
MDIEHDVKMVRVGPDFQKDVEQLRVDGWKLVPGTTPVAIYTMFREKIAADVPIDVGFAQGEMIMDDTKVGILRSNGKFERF